MAITADEVAERFPIHWLVWNNQHEELKEALESKKFTSEDLEKKDPRGRTPLLLAVTLNHIEAVRALLDAGADVNCEKDGWTAVQEATATGDAELLSLVLSRRDFQRHVVRASGIPDLLHRLSLAPDFYVEMKWEFTSWVPLVSRMCPFDTYKVYKRGGNVRVDTTLVGFENNRWQRGDRTYIFRGQGRSASLIELDHEAGTSWREYVEPIDSQDYPPPNPRLLQQRLAAPVAINYLDTDKICFERSKTGIWGWRQDKTENVNGYECKVFSANNVELVSKTRSEHLPAQRRQARPSRAPLAGLLALADGEAEPEQQSPTAAEPEETRSEHLPAQRRQARPSRAPLAGLLALADGEAEPEQQSPATAEPEEEERLIESRRSTPTPPAVSWAEYFGEEAPSSDVGRAQVLDTKVQKFRATLWLCEDYPLELQEQIMPILDLMAAISSPHFAKLKDFIQMQLPSGFPVKIEIPLFHVLNARITFGNIFATESPVTHVECIREGDRLACVLDDACFAAGTAYTAAEGARLADDEESLLQYAIQQSLMEAGTSDDQVDVWEALRGARPASPAPPRPELLTHEERELQRAIEASLSGVSAMTLAPADVELTPLERALQDSAREHEQRRRQLLEEQRALDEALRLSLLEQ